MSALSFPDRCPCSVSDLSLKFVTHCVLCGCSYDFVFLVDYANECVGMALADEDPLCVSWVKSH